MSQLGFSCERSRFLCGALLKKMNEIDYINYFMIANVFESPHK